jgi:outer membrane protein assembly factor BamA
MTRRPPLSALVAALLSLCAQLPPPPPAPAPPPGFEARPPLSAADLEQKREGGYFTGLPLVNYDSNTGVGFGARGYYYYDGARSDPLFAYTPYQYRVFLQAFFTTGGMQYHWLDIDSRSIGGTPYLFRGQFMFERNVDQHYFGIGARTREPLSVSRSTARFRHFDEYQRELDRIDEQGETRARYDSYRFLRPMALLSLERPLWGGRLRPLLGAGISYNQIDDVTGETVSISTADGERRAIMGASRLQEDCQAGLIEGCEGGWNNFLRLGLSFDTRDYEPDPNQGVFVDAALDVGTALLGSEYDWARVMLSPRLYFSPVPELADLVLAARATLQVQSRRTPFFAMNLLPFTEEPRPGLGGLRTLRGYKQDRFVGPVMTLVNAELRWTFLRFDAGSQKFGLIAVPFLDLGSVYDRPEELAFTGWKRDQGLALRASWNLATIIVVEYAVSVEDSGFYVNFNHIF